MTRARDVTAVSAPSGMSCIRSGPWYSKMKQAKTPTEIANCVGRVFADGLTATATQPVAKGADVEVAAVSEDPGAEGVP